MTVNEVVKILCKVNRFADIDFAKRNVNPDIKEIIIGVEIDKAESILKNNHFIHEITYSVNTFSHMRTFPRDEDMIVRISLSDDGLDIKFEEDK